MLFFHDCRMSNADTSSGGIGDSEVGESRSDPKKKRGREASRSRVLEKHLKKKKTTKLDVQFDEFTGRSIGTHGVYFNNLIAQLVRDTISPRTTCWDDVPKEDIQLIFDRLDVSN